MAGDMAVPLLQFCLPVLFSMSALSTPHKHGCVRKRGHSETNDKFITSRPEGMLMKSRQLNMQEIHQI